MRKGASYVEGSVGVAAWTMGFIAVCGTYSRLWLSIGGYIYKRMGDSAPLFRLQVENPSECGRRIRRTDGAGSPFWLLIHTTRGAVQRSLNWAP